MRLDPLSKVAGFNYVFDLILRDRLEDADRELEKLASIYPVFYADRNGELMAIGGKWTNFALGSLDALQINPESAFRKDLPFELALIGLEQEALSIFETIQPEVLSILGRPKDAVLMAALIAIRRDAGEEAGASKLLAAIKDNVQRLHEAGLTKTFWKSSVDYEDGLVAYLSGEREKGLSPSSALTIPTRPSGNPPREPANSSSPRPRTELLLRLSFAVDSGRRTPN